MTGHSSFQLTNLQNLNERLVCSLDILCYAYRVCCYVVFNLRSINTQMGAAQSTTRSQLKNDMGAPCVQTIFQSPKFRFGFKMKATMEEAEKLNEKWTDFTSGVKDNFVYHTETQKSPQFIMVSRNGDKLKINVSTTMDLEKDDIGKLTDMFAHSTSVIRKYHTVPGKAGLHVKEKSSSTNLLA